VCYHVPSSQLLLGSLTRRGNGRSERSHRSNVSAQQNGFEEAKCSYRDYCPVRILSIRCQAFTFDSVPISLYRPWTWRRSAPLGPRIEPCYPDEVAHIFPLLICWRPGAIGIRIVRDIRNQCPPLAGTGRVIIAMKTDIRKLLSDSRNQTTDHLEEVYNFTLARILIPG